MRNPRSTPAAAYNTDRSYMQPTSIFCFFAEDIPWLPQEVADWLYNATHYAIPLLQTLLGTHKAFDSKGCYVDSSNTPASGGQLAAWRGTELGSRRDRALIAYDTNANFQAFVTPCCDFSKVWGVAAPVLESFDLSCRVMVPGKHYRICPKNPLTFDEWLEFCREASIGLTESMSSRSEDVVAAAKSKMKTGKQPAAPIGPHYLDIFVKVVSPKSSIDVTQEASGAKHPVPVQPCLLFPIVEGFFGPLRIPLPQTSAVLDLRFGSRWRTKAAARSVPSKSNLKSGSPTYTDSGFGKYCILMPDDCRRAVHPAVPMTGCPDYLGCFRGASVDAQETDVIWRWLSPP